MKLISLIMLVAFSLQSFGADKISGDFYTNDSNSVCYILPVIQIEVDFNLKTFKNSYIDNQFGRDNFTPPADQAFSEKESCYSPPGWERQYCATANFNSNSVLVSQYYRDYGHAYGSFTEVYTFSENLVSFKRSIGNSNCNYNFAKPRVASKNDLLLKNGAIFKVSKLGNGFLSDPTGLVWTDVLRKNDQVLASNFQEAKSYCESKSMRLPTTGEAHVLLYYLKGSSPIKVIGTNYFLEELFPDFSKFYYWDNERRLYSAGGTSWTEESNRQVPFDSISIGVRCVTRK